MSDIEKGCEATRDVTDTPQHNIAPQLVPRVEELAKRHTHHRECMECWVRLSYASCGRIVHNESGRIGVTEPPDLAVRNFGF